MVFLGARLIAIGLVALGTAPAGAELPYEPTGLASWYGAWHHGRTTASGERFDMHAMTAAHRTLPLGTRIRVTNLENDRTVELRVNDRGPFIGNRILDLSRAAAQRLGALAAGVVRVRIDVLEVPMSPALASRDRPSLRAAHGPPPHRVAADAIHLRRAAGRHEDRPADVRAHRATSRTNTRGASGPESVRRATDVERTTTAVRRAAGHVDRIAP
jgi:rare lipoprotein A